MKCATPFLVAHAYRRSMQFALTGRYLPYGQWAEEAWEGAFREMGLSA